MSVYKRFEQVWSRAEIGIKPMWGRAGSKHELTRPISGIVARKAGAPLDRLGIKWAVRIPRVNEAAMYVVLIKGKL
jgi:hypothetical protein